MSRDYADKDFLRYRAPKKKWGRRIFLLFIGLGLLAFGIHKYFPSVESRIQQGIFSFKTHQAQVKKKVSDLMSDLPKPPKDEDIHFEFYDTLPAMQVKSISENHSHPAGLPPPKLPMGSDDEKIKMESEIAKDTAPKILENKLDKNTIVQKENENRPLDSTNTQEDDLSVEFSKHLKKQIKPNQYQILLAVFNTQVAAESYRDRLHFGNKITISKLNANGRTQFKVMILGIPSEAEAKAILLRYQNSGWAKQGKIQNKEGG